MLPLLALLSLCFISTPKKKKWSQTVKSKARGNIKEIFPTLTRFSVKLENKKLFPYFGHFSSTSITRVCIFSYYKKKSPLNSQNSLLSCVKISQRHAFFFFILKKRNNYKFMRNFSRYIHKANEIRNRKIERRRRFISLKLCFAKKKNNKKWNFCRESFFF